MLIEEKEQFQSSTEVLEKWLATGKSSINIEEVTMHRCKFLINEIINGHE